MPALRVSFGLGKGSFQSGQWLGNGGDTGGTKVVYKLYSILVSFGHIGCRFAQKTLCKNWNSSPLTAPYGVLLAAITTWPECG